MSRYTQYQANFTGGELDPLLRARIDLQQYYNCVALAENVEFQPQGGFTRRPGLRFLADLTGDNPDNGVLLIPFEFSTTQRFMIVASVVTSTGTIRFRFYANQVLQTAINGGSNDYLDVNVTMFPTGGSTTIDMNKTYYTQSADTLIIVNENFAPIKLVRGANNSAWTASNISFTSPKTQFTAATTNPSATVTATATTGATKVTASAGVFSSGNVDQYINVLNGFGRARIVNYVSTTVVEVVMEIPFFSTDAVASGDWELETGYEDSFSSTRGYPRTCSFHEGRLYFGGSYSEPATLFGSKVGDYYNFKPAEDLADDALKVTLFTDQVNAITALKAGRDLQIFTTGGEFFVPQADLDPVTPTNITIKSTTSRGSKEGIRPQSLESGTLFIQRQGKAVREMKFSDTDLSYVANNISLLNSHMLVDPQRMAIRSATDTTEGDLLLIVNGTSTTGYRAASVGFAGTITAFTLNRPQQIVAPANWSTDGTFIDVGVDLDTIYVVVKRTINSVTKYYLEVFDDDRTTDSSIQYYSGSTAPDQGLPVRRGNETFLLLGRLEHLQGKTVKIIRDDIVDTDATVSTTAAVDDAIVVQEGDPNGNRSLTYTINGTMAYFYTAAFNGVARKVTFTGYNSSDPSFPIFSGLNIVVTITGTDTYGSAQTETLNLDQDTITHTGVKFFSTVTGISLNTNATGFTTKVGVAAASTATITAPDVTTYAEAGLDYDVEVKTMPVEARLPTGSMQTTRRRILEVSPILDRSQHLTVNGKDVGISTSTSGAATSFTGIKTIEGLAGYDTDGQITISQTKPLFFTVLGVDYKLSSS